MISICRACSHMACRHRIGSSRLTHLSFVRLLGIGLRVIRAVPSSSSFVRYGAAGRPRRRHHAGGVLGIPRACGPASCYSSIRYERRGDDAPGHINLRTVSMAGGGGSCQVPFVSMWSCSRSLTPFRPASSFVRYEKRDGGLFVVPRPVVCPLVAVVDGIADGDGVPVDGV